MGHFDITRWADFVRGIARGSDRLAMHRHLATGCDRCSREVAALEKMAGFARVDAGFDPPEEVVGAAEDLARSVPSRVSDEVSDAFRDGFPPQLLYDNWNVPVLAGIRGSGHLQRQVLFQVGDTYVDLLLNRVPNTPRIRLVGQVSSRRDPERAPVSEPVLLRSGNRTVRRVQPNEFREFQMEYGPIRGLRLQIPMGGDRTPFELLLDDVEPASPARVPPLSLASPKRVRRPTRPRTRQAPRRR